MNKRLLILLLSIVSIPASAQFYLRGEVRDEHNNLLTNAKILLHSTGYLYSSGGSGSFGILTSKNTDSITVSLAGYQPCGIATYSSRYLVVTLKLLHSTINTQKNKLLSFTKDLELEDKQDRIASGESYSSRVENGFVEAEKYPESGFAVRIDKASYSNVRRFINMESEVPRDAVRIEELMNYFNFGYTDPVGDRIFSCTSQLSDCPWNPASRLLYLHLSAKKIDPEMVPPGNLVFLIDVSGSMDMPNRLPLLQSAFKLLVDNLREKDTISIVVYGGAVGVVLTPTSGKEKIKIRKVIEGLTPGGSTPGQSGILSAYSLAKNQFIKGGNNRVILATDGDFNIGQTSEEQLEKLITSHQETGIYLTCLGVGMGNYKDSKLEVLAKKGNGNFAYLDNEFEAEKVLVKELTQTLYSVADDASLNIRFNKKYVKEYRLLGYDNKLKALADSLTELEGGEVGSGYSTMVLFEIIPANQIGSALQDPFSSAFQKDSIAGVQINYRLPADTTSRVSSFRIPYNYVGFNDLPDAYRFATTIALFGSLLKASAYTKNITWPEMITMAYNAYDKTDLVQKECIMIMEKARKIYGKRKNRKKD